MASLTGQHRLASTRIVNILGFNKARETGWHWHQVDHVHIICTLLQLIADRLDAFPDAQSTTSLVDVLQNYIAK